MIIMKFIAMLTTGRPVYASKIETVPNWSAKKRTLVSPASGVDNQTEIN